MHCMFFASKHLLVVSNIFCFHPYLGKWSNLPNLFQTGWNHQLKTHFIPFPWFLYSSKDLEELLGPKNKIGISGGTTDVWHLTDDKSQNFIRIVIIMVMIVMIVLDDVDDALLCLCCWCGCSFLLHGWLPMAYVLSFVVSSSVTPRCLTSFGRLAHHLVDVKQSNGRTISTPLKTNMEPKKCRFSGSSRQF